MRKFSLKKALCLFCVISLVLSVMIPLTLVTWADPVPTTFTAQSKTVDFSEYAITSNFKTPYTSAGSAGGVYTDGYFFKVNNGTLRYVRSKDEQDIYNERGQRRNNLTAFTAFPFSSNGSVKADKSFLVTAGEVYRMNVTYKIDTLTDNQPFQLKAAYTSENGSGDSVGTDVVANKKEQVKLFTDVAMTKEKVYETTTNGYVTETYYFSFPSITAFTYNAGGYKPCYAWFFISTPTDANGVVMGDFDITFDAISLDTVATAAFHTVDIDGNVADLTASVAGNTDSVVDFSAAESQIKAASDKEVTSITWYRDADKNDEVTELGSETFTNAIHSDYYAYVEYSENNRGDIKVDFENYHLRVYAPADAGTAHFSNTGYSINKYSIIDSAEAHSGSKVLRFQTSANDNAQRDASIYVGDGVDLEDRSLYKMTFFYKKDATAANTDYFNFTFYNGLGLYSQMSYPTSYGYSEICQSTQRINASEMPDIWTQVTLYCYIDYSARNNQLNVLDKQALMAPEIVINGKNGGAVSVLIDDVTITKVGGGTGKKGMVVLHSLDENNYMFGAVDSALTLEPLSNTDTKIFKGWFADSAYANAFTANKYTDTAIHAYAKFEDKPDVDPTLDPNPADIISCSFDDYPSGWMKYNQIIRFDRFSVTADAAYGTTGKGLDYHFVPSSDPTVSGTDLEPNTGYNKLISNSVMLSANTTYIPVEDKTWYKVNFRYKALTVPEKVRVYMMTSSKDGAWGVDKAGKGLYQEYTDNDYTIFSNDVNGKWNDGEIIFQTNFKGANGNVLYLWVGTSTRAEAQVYFDDVKIVKTTEPIKSEITTFESYPKDFATYEGKMRYDRFTISSADSYAGTKSVLYDYDPENHQSKTGYNRPISCSFALYNNGNVLVEDDTLYRVTFMYKAVAMNTNVTINMMTSCPGNMWQNITLPDGTLVAYYNQYTDYGYTIHTTAVGQGWVQGELYFKTDLMDVSADPASQKKNSGSNGLFFWVGANADVRSTIYFDNIGVEKVDASKGVMAYVTDDDIGTYYQVGIVGDRIKLPDMSSFTQYSFYGWYNDEIHTSKFTGKTVAAGINRVYAFLITPMNVSFEDYPKAWTTNTGKFRYDRFSINSGEVPAADGDKVLKYYYEPWMGQYTNPDIGWNATTYNKERSCCVMLNKQGSGIKLVNGGYYKLTFSYYDVYGTGIDVIPYAGNENGIWNGTATKFESSAYRISPSEQGKGWQTTTVYVKADCDDANNTWLYLWVGLIGDETTLCYFDNICVEQLYTDGMGIFFDFAVSGTTIAYRDGNINEKIDFPSVPSITNFDFNGWYADKDCTVPFTATKYNKIGFYTVYAKWVAAKKSFFDFEGTYSTQGLNRSTYERVDGNTVWCVDTYNPHERNFGGTMIMPSGIHYRLNQDEQYMISVKYYTDEIAEGAKASLYFQTCDKDSVWSSYANASPTVKLSLEKGVWKTAYFFVSSNPVRPQSNYLCLFASQVSGVRLYFDDVEINRVDSDEALVFYTLNHEGSSLNVPYVIVPKGTRVTMPKPALKDFLFKGWYNDVEYKDAYQETTYTANENKNFYGCLYQTRFFNGFEDNKEQYVPDRIVNCDPDYEVETGGAHNGKYALHRHGDWYDYQGFMVIPGAKNAEENCPTLTDNVVYTISYWVRIESCEHNLGAVRLAGTQAARFCWGTVGDVHNTVAIADINDGQWHKISYTFTSATYRYAMFTPGYVNAWFDDIEILATPSAEASTSVTVEEYIPYLKDDKHEHDDEVITIPEDLFIKAGTAGESGFFDDILNFMNEHLLASILIAAGAVLVIGGGTTGIVFAIKHKNKKKGAAS